MNEQTSALEVGANLGVQLIRASIQCDEQVAVGRSGKGRRANDLERRTVRALNFVQVGELSTAHQALGCGSSHFGSRLSLLTRESRIRSLSGSFFCCLCKPHAVHAAQGMELHRHTQWLVRGHQGTTPAFSLMASRSKGQGKEGKGGKPVAAPRAPLKTPQKAQSKGGRLEAALQALGQE